MLDQTPVQQLKSFLDKFDPAIAAQIRDCRGALRKRFPTANELVYDNYNLFVIGYCTNERPSVCVVSIAANSKGVGLSFYYGAALFDPHRVLEGSGSQNRFVRLPDGAESLARDEIQNAAEAQADPPFATAGKGRLIIRSVPEKQCPRK